MFEGPSALFGGSNSRGSTAQGILGGRSVLRAGQKDAAAVTVTVTKECCPGWDSPLQAALPLLG